MVQLRSVYTSTSIAACGVSSGAAFIHNGSGCSLSQAKTWSAMACEGEHIVLTICYFSIFISTLSNEPLITVTRNKSCGRPAQSRMSLI